MVLGRRGVREDSIKWIKHKSRVRVIAQYLFSKKQLKQTLINIFPSTKVQTHKSQPQEIRLKGAKFTLLECNDALASRTNITCPFHSAPLYLQLKTFSDGPAIQQLHFSKVEALLQEQASPRLCWKTMEHPGPSLKEARLPPADPAQAVLGAGIYPCTCSSAELFQREVLWAIAWVHLIQE